MPPEPDADAAEIGASETAPMPDSLRRFNWAAMLNSTLWALTYGLWRWFWLLVAMNLAAGSALLAVQRLLPRAPWPLLAALTAVIYGIQWVVAIRFGRDANGAIWASLLHEASGHHVMRVIRPAVEPAAYRTSQSRWLTFVGVSMALNWLSLLSAQVRRTTEPAVTVASTCAFAAAVATAWALHRREPREHPGKPSPEQQAVMDAERPPAPAHPVWWWVAALVVAPIWTNSWLAWSGRVYSWAQNSADSRPLAVFSVFLVCAVGLWATYALARVSARQGAPSSMWAAGVVYLVGYLGISAPDVFSGSLIDGSWSWLEFATPLAVIALVMVTVRAGLRSGVAGDGSGDASASALSAVTGPGMTWDTLRERAAVHHKAIEAAGTVALALPWTWYVAAAASRVRFDEPLPMAVRGATVVAVCLLAAAATLVATRKTLAGKQQTPFERMTPAQIGLLGIVLLVLADLLPALAILGIIT